MRIMQISGFLVGAQKTIEEGIHEFLIKNGHTSCILYQMGDGDMEYEYKYENGFENLLSRGLRKMVGKNPKVTFLQTVKVIRYIKKFRPDIIHFHVLHDGCVDYAYLWKYIKKNKISVVYTMHDLWAMTGGCYHYTQNHCQEYLSGCKQCKAAMAQLDCNKSLVEKQYQIKKTLLTSIPSMRIVTVSDWVKNEFEKSFLAEKSISRIHNGVYAIDEKCIKKIADNHTNKTSISIISIACYWDQSKGIDRVFEVAKFLGESFSFILVGRVSKEIAKDAPENVHFVGFCSERDQLYALLKNSDLHVSFSFEETFGMTFIEAAFVGTRSIGYGSTAIKEILSLVNGFCVDTLTSKAMSETILHVVKNNNLKLSEREINRIKKYFSIDRMASEYCNLYLSSQ